MSKTLPLSHSALENANICEEGINTINLPFYGQITFITHKNYRYTPEKIKYLIIGDTTRETHPAKLFCPKNVFAYYVCCIYNQMNFKKLFTMEENAMIPGQTGLILFSSYF